MALRAAVANGNWSLASTWNGGVIPSPGDVVASNGFTVTIDQNINVDSLTNAATSPVTVVPIMTGNTTPSGIVTASSAFSSAYDSWRAFDGSTSSGWITANTVLTGWVAYEFTTAKIITSYVLAGGATGGNSFPRNWTFEGWDGSNWIILHTVTGNTNTSTYTGTFTNTTAYIRYRINITLNNGNTSYTGINEMYLYDLNSVLTTTTAGGGFVLNSGVTVTTINGIQAGNTTCLTYSGTGTSTIIGSINPPNTQPSVYTYALIHNGSGTLNINGHLNASFASNNRGCLSFTGSGVLNVTGTISGGFANSPNVNASGTGTINVVGDITGGSNVTSLSCGGSVRLNLTGNVGGGTNTGRGISFDGAGVIATITGNLVVGLGGGSAINFNAGANLTITGNIGDNLFSGGITLLQAQSNSSYIKIIGTIFAGSNVAHFNSTGLGAINILTGPFISSSTGIQPFYVARMHYQRTLGSYYEFRDSSTNGALPPVAPAPTTRLNSPEVGSDLPAVANVRFGTTYGYGSLTGTLRMPHPNQVTYGVAVDNTFGTAVLTAASVWDYLVANITVENSIGMRLKNVATPQTTGSQLAALL